MYVLDNNYKIKNELEKYYGVPLEDKNNG